MFKAKYQAHKLVNIIFYIIVFLIGFYMGVMGQKIGIRDLFSKFLFIDNVEAFTIDTIDGVVLDEDFIVQKTLEAFPNIDLSVYNKYLITYIYGYPTLGKYISVHIMTSEGVEDLRVWTKYNSGSSAWYPLYTLSNQPMYRFSYKFDDDSLYGAYHYISEANNPDSTVASLHSKSSTTEVDYSNFNVNGIDTYESGYNSVLNKMFFSNYYYSFNKNLFSDNHDFKQVCVNPKNAFAISYTELYQNKNSFGDYIWFPYNIIYLNYGRYNTLNSKMIFDEPTTDKHIFFNSSEKFDLFNTVDGLQLVDGFNAPITSSYPYNTRYNYFGWSAYPFAVGSANSDSPDIPVYKFSENFMTVQLSSFGIAHGGGTRIHYDLNDENNQNLSMCFYINKFYTVTELTENGTGNYEGVISTPNGDITLYSITGGDFFGSFHEEDFGLTAIVTAPLNAIRQISNGTCIPQTITILGKSITLPCGDTIFWDREDVQDFKIFWNMFFGGILCYGIGLSLYRKIHKFTNPLDDRVEVIDL